MFTLLLVLSLSAQAAPNDDVAVYAAQDARMAAMVRGDVAFLSGALDASLTYQHSTGVAQTKEEFIKAIGDGRLKYKSMEAIERRARRFGSIVIVTGIIHFEAINNTEVVDTRARFTDVYESKNGRFIQVAWQNTRLPNP